MALLKKKFHLMAATLSMPVCSILQGGANIVFFFFHVLFSFCHHGSTNTLPQEAVGGGKLVPRPVSAHLAFSLPAPPLAILPPLIVLSVSCRRKLSLRPTLADVILGGCRQRATHEAEIR